MRVCPIHPIRQLSDNGYCVDCGFTWLEEVLKNYEKEFDWINAQYQEEYIRANDRFREKVRGLREKAVLQNIKLKKNVVSQK